MVFDQGLSLFHTHIMIHKLQILPVVVFVFAFGASSWQKRFESSKTKTHSVPSLH